LQSLAPFFPLAAFVGMPLSPGATDGTATKLLSEIGMLPSGFVVSKDSGSSR
jgi:hypothetical protein